MFATQSRGSISLLLSVSILSLVVTYYLLSYRPNLHLLSPVKDHQQQQQQQEKGGHSSGSSSSHGQLDFVAAPEQGSGVPRPATLRELCDQTKWTPGLYIQCHSNTRTDDEGKIAIHGGLNNVRNRIQSCVRVAIDAGAGIIMPKIATRSQTALKNLGFGEPVPASRYWDMEHMEETLRRECAQLEIRYEMRDIRSVVKAPKRHYKAARYWKGTFRDMVLRVLDRGNVDFGSIGMGNKTAVSFGDTFLSWDYEQSNELDTIRKDLFKTLTYNRTLLSISSQILKSPQLKDGFIGIHLRASNDWPNSFGNAFTQMKLYTQEIEKIERKKLGEMRTLYVSCGNKTKVELFRQKLAPLGYRLWDKWSLLADDPKTLAVVEGLLFDEKGAVEYEMLLNAKFFIGPFMSSMSQLIAYARSVDTEDGFFEKRIFPGSVKDRGENGVGIRRKYPVTPLMKGDERTKLLVVNGDDIMSFYP